MVTLPPSPVSSHRGRFSVFKKSNWPKEPLVISVSTCSALHAVCVYPVCDITNMSSHALNCIDWVQQVDICASGVWTCNTVGVGKSTLNGCKELLHRRMWKHVTELLTINKLTRLCFFFLWFISTSIYNITSHFALKRSLILKSKCGMNQFHQSNSEM